MIFNEKNLKERSVKKLEELNTYTRTDKMKFK